MSEYVKWFDSPERETANKAFAEALDQYYGEVEAHAAYEEARALYLDKAEAEIDRLNLSVDFWKSRARAAEAADANGGDS